MSFPAGLRTLVSQNESEIDRITRQSLEVITTHKGEMKGDLFSCVACIRNKRFTFNVKIEENKISNAWLSSEVKNDRTKDTAKAKKVLEKYNQTIIVEMCRKSHVHHINDLKKTRNPSLTDTGSSPHPHPVDTPRSLSSPPKITSESEPKQESKQHEYHFVQCDDDDVFTQNSQASGSSASCELLLSEPSQTFPQKSGGIKTSRSWSSPSSQSSTSTLTEESGLQQAALSLGDVNKHSVTMPNKGMIRSATQENFASSYFTPLGSGVASQSKSLSKLNECIKRENRDLKGKFSKFQIEIHELKTSISELTKTKRLLNQQLGDAEEERCRLEQENKSITDAHHSAQTEAAQLRLELHKKQKEIAKLKSVNQVLSQLSSLTLELYNVKDEGGEQKDMLSNIHALQKLIAQERSLLDVQRAERDEQERTLELKRREIELRAEESSKLDQQSKSQLAQAKVELAELKSKDGKIRQKIQADLEEQELVTRALVKVQADIEFNDDRRKKLVAGTKAELQLVNQRYTRLQEKLREAETQFKSIIGVLSKCRQLTSSTPSLSPDDVIKQIREILSAEK